MSWIFFALAGLAGGLLGGMGMGGGTLLIPILTLFLDLPQRQAQLANLIAFVPMAAVALIIHIKAGMVDKKRLLYVIIPALITAPLTSILAQNMQNAHLKQAFGAFLIVLGLAQASVLIYQFILRRRQQKPLQPLRQR